MYQMIKIILLDDFNVQFGRHRIACVNTKYKSITDYELRLLLIYTEFDLFLASNYFKPMLSYKTTWMHLIDCTTVCHHIINDLFDVIIHYGANVWSDHFMVIADAHTFKLKLHHRVVSPPKNLNLKSVIWLLHRNLNEILHP